MTDPSQDAVDPAEIAHSFLYHYPPWMTAAAGATASPGPIAVWRLQSAMTERAVTCWLNSSRCSDAQWETASCSRMVRLEQEDLASLDLPLRSYCRMEKVAFAVMIERFAADSSFPMRLSQAFPMAVEDR